MPLPRLPPLPTRSPSYSPRGAILEPKSTLSAQEQACLLLLHTPCDLENLQGIFHLASATKGHCDPRLPAFPGLVAPAKASHGGEGKCHWGRAERVWCRPPCLPANSSTGFPQPATHWTWPALCLPWDQVNKQAGAAAAQARRGSRLCLRTCRGQQLCSAGPEILTSTHITCQPLQGNGAQDAQGLLGVFLLFFFNLHRKKQIIIETRDFMLSFA